MERPTYRGFKIKHKRSYLFMMMYSCKKIKIISNREGKMEGF
jgi:hypothetical protein